MIETIAKFQLRTLVIGGVGKRGLLGLGALLQCRIPRRQRNGRTVTQMKRCERQLGRRAKRQQKHRTTTMMITMLSEEQTKDGVG